MILVFFLWASYRGTELDANPEIGRHQIYLSIGEMLLRNFQRSNFRPSLCEGGLNYGLLSCFSGTLVVFQLIQAAYCPNYYESSFEHRARIAKDILPRNTPDTTMAALGTISTLVLINF